MVIDAIIQARMTSTRFPGKVLSRIRGVSILHKICSMLYFDCNTKIRNIIVIAPNEEKSNEMRSSVEELGKFFIAGHSKTEDVLGRYYEAATRFNSKHILRITSDCPLINGKLILKLVSVYKKSKGKVYCGLDVPNTVPDGMDAEIFPFWMLEESHKKATNPYDREHVTPYMKHKYFYKLVGTSIDFSSVKLSVDVPEDLRKVKDWIDYFS